MQWMEVAMFKKVIRVSLLLILQAREGNSEFSVSDRLTRSLLQAAG